MAILVQTTFGDDLRVTGVAPDLMVLLAICAGLTGGAESGAWVGFWAGLLADLFLTATPLGLSALTYCLVGAAVGALRTGGAAGVRVVIPAAAVVGTAAAVLLWVGLGDVLGQSQLLDSRPVLADPGGPGRGGVGGAAGPAGQLALRPGGTAARRGAERVGAIKAGVAAARAGCGAR